MAGYLDTATGMPPSDLTLRALAGGWDQAAADPGRRYDPARRSRAVLDQARAGAARLWGVDPAGLYFAPDRGVAVWWALTGFQHSHPRLVVSAVEDLTVLRTADVVATPDAPTEIAAVDATGRVDAAALAAQVGAAGPATVVVQDGNLEIGTRQPLAEIRAVTVGHRLVVDLQGVAGRIEPAAEWDAAFAEARMWGGPPGVTIVATRHPSQFRPTVAITDGHGHLEDAFPPVPLIAAAVLALENPDPGWPATAEVTRHLRERVSHAIDDVQIAGDPHRQLPYLTMFSFLYVAADEMIDGLARRGWAVASGASCTSDTRRPHHVLVAVGALTHGSLRVSVGPTTTVAEIDAFVTDLIDVVRDSRSAAGAGDL